MHRAQPIRDAPRLGVVASWVAGTLLALPVLAFRYPPMGDLAMHEALVSILRHQQDASWAPPGMYFVVAPQANQLFHWVACALAFVVATDTACKLVVATTVAAVPIATARLLAHLHKSTWPALLLAPIAYGWMFRWGLVANLTGYALFLFALPSAERLAHRPTRSNAALVVLAACAIFFAHEAAAITYAIVVGYSAVARGRSWKGIALRIAPVFVVAALVVLELRIGGPLMGANMRAIGNDYGAEAPERLALLPGAIFGGVGNTRLWLLASACGIALAANLACHQEDRGRRVPVPVAMWRHRYALLAVVLLLFYFLMPMTLSGSTMIAHRFLPGAWACMVVASAPRAGSSLAPTTLRGRSIAAAAFAALVPLVVVASSWNAFRDADASHRALDTIIAQVPRNVAVAQLDLTPRPAGHVAPVPGAASRVQAERGGRMLFALTDMPPYPLYVDSAHAWNEAILRLAHSPYALMPAFDLHKFAYLLERNDNPRARALVEQALAPEADVVARAREWTLFRSHVLTVGPDAPDTPLPTPTPEMLVERVNRLVEMAARAPSDEP